MELNKRTLRWVVPVLAAGTVAAVTTGILSANANPNLPDQNAAQLLAAVGNTSVAAFSGTVVEKASLGLPELPDIGGSSGTAGLLSLLSGSHTVRLWYDGPTRQRAAMLTSLGEQDIFRNGTELWQYDSNTHTATHSTLPAAADEAPSPSPTQTMSPDAAAAAALALIGPSTDVTTDKSAIVAGRAAYVLVLSPKDTTSTIGSVRISIDGENKIPLGVQVIPRGTSKPALDISFTRIDFSRPSLDNFTYKPADGTTVKESTTPFPSSDKHTPVSGADSVTAIGSGWTSVVKYTSADSQSVLGGDNKSLTLVLGALPAVKGTWGAGRLFSSSLVNILITDDGRLYAGAVTPDVLYAAAAK